jgi:hypothetical protein
MILRNNKGDFMSICLNQTSHIGSNKFGFISSSNLVQTLENKGLKLADVVESKIRKNKETRLRTGFYALNKETNVSTKIRAIRGAESNVIINNALFNEAMKFAA